jgi:hypothetical protein
LAIRKKALKKLVHERLSVLRQRGKSLARGKVAIAGKAQIQIFR